MPPWTFQLVAGARLLASGALVGHLLTGCAQGQVSLLPGRLHLALAAGRHVAYTASQLAVLKVTLTDLTHSSSTVQRLSPATLVHGTFSFLALNLLPGTYQARLDAYVDGQEAVLAGTSTSGVFTVAGGSTTQVDLPSMTLAATPVGDWKVTAKVTLNGYSLASLAFALTGFDGRGLTTTQTNKALTWGNVAAVAGQVSTTSITVNFKRKGTSYTKVAFATASVLPGTTTTSTIGISLP